MLPGEIWRSKDMREGGRKIKITKITWERVYYCNPFGVPREISCQKDRFPKMFNRIEE